ncbi:ATP-binding protein, partial [Rhodopirellula bahusiensis]
VDEGEAYQEKIRRHRELPPYSDRRTYVTLTATRSQAVFVIRDQGPGYDVSALPDPTDPANLESIGGRGLLLISAFMDEIHHNEIGNELTMIKRKRSDSSAL